MRNPTAISRLLRTALAAALLACFLPPVHANGPLLEPSEPLPDRDAQSRRWPQFRGAQAAGTADNLNLPVRWSAEHNVAWKTEVPGHGWSSPIVWDGKVYVTSAIVDGPYKEPCTGIFGNGTIVKLLTEGKTIQEASKLVSHRDTETPEEGGVVRRTLCCLDADTDRYDTDDLILLSAGSVWYQPKGGTYVPTPVAYRGNLSAVYDKGFLAAFDIGSGKRLFMARIGKRNSFSASPWAYDGKIFALSEDGETFVFEAGNEYKLLHTNELDEMTLASPALTGDGLFLRTDQHVYRLGTASLEQ